MGRVPRMREIPSPLVVVTDRHLARRPLETIVSEAVSAGARWIWLRDRDLEREQRRRLALRLAGIVREVHGVLSIGADLELARDTGSAAVHLRDVASIAQARHVLGASALIGMSAHGAADAAAARAAGADYVTLSPIYPSASKPGYGPALGPEAIALAAKERIPVIALGGIAAENVGALRAAGAAGIAVMGGIMGAQRPAEVVRDLLGRLSPVARHGQRAL
jgi:thiamine-phosphate pyrophosphorylase